VPRKMKVMVRWYKASSRVYGGVEVGVLEPLGGREVMVSSSDPIEALLKVAEEEARSGKGDYVEVSLDDGETRRIMGVGPRYTWSRPLSYKPERLLRIGIVRHKGGGEPVKEESGETEESPEAQETVSLELLPEDVEWHDVEEEVYVFEGKAQMVEGAEPVSLIIIETPSGSRLVRPAPASLRKRKSS
jgi:hypothetical protein